MTVDYFHVRVLRAQAMYDSGVESAREFIAHDTAPHLPLGYSRQERASFVLGYYCTIRFTPPYPRRHRCAHLPPLP